MYRVHVGFSGSVCIPGNIVQAVEFASQWMKGEWTETDFFISRFRCNNCLIFCFHYDVRIFMLVHEPNHHDQLCLGKTHLDLKKLYKLHCTGRNGHCSTYNVEHND